MALLVRPGSEKNTIVVGREEDYTSLLDNASVELWPPAWQLDAVIGPEGQKYRFDIWVGEDSRLRDEKVNLCASLAAHPLNEARGRVIYGRALLVPLENDVAYTLDDWANICQAVWYDGGLVSLNSHGALADTR
jgi:hypothetical protein